MRLSDMLIKYENNNNLKLYLENVIINPSKFISIVDNDTYYDILPTEEFNQLLHATNTKLQINKELKIKHVECGCLQFFKNKDCIHELCLYLTAIYILDPELYNNEFDRFNNLKNLSIHKDLLKKLTNDILTTNPYFGKIHLIPIIIELEKNYEFSLKIGYDKDYVIKDIKEFMYNIENNIFYSYGQKLEFVHSYECLDNVSKILYTFLGNIVGDETTKSQIIRKSHLLRILEIYKSNIIFFKRLNDEKPTSRLIQEDNNTKLELDDNYLYIKPYNNSKPLVSGVNYSYFINDTMIYAYPYINRTESKIYENLYKLNGKLLIESNPKDFIADVLPLIKNQIRIKDVFYQKYPVPNIKINSYFTYENKQIVLNYKIACQMEDRNSPYLNQLLEGYIKSIENYSFIMGVDRKYYLSPLELQYNFLTSDLSTLKSFGEVFFDDKMKNIKTKKSSRTSISISYDIGLLDFKFVNENLTIDDIKDMLKAYNEKKKFVRLKDDSILEITDSDAREISNFLEDFNINIDELDKPVKKSLNYVLKLVSGVDTNVDLDLKVIEMIETIQNYNKSKYEPSELISKKLRKYQIEAYKWLKTLSSYGFGGILADDMGLGKTLEIISFLTDDDAKKPSLIVCPMSLVFNWENECEKWQYNAPVKLILGTSDEREAVIKGIKNKEKVLYITSYDSLRRDSELYSKVSFKYIIADEAQFIKNQYAQKSEAIKSLKSEINFALTGTPIENGLADLWSIFDFLMPGYLSNYSHFKSRYESLIVHDDTEALLNLKKRVLPFILRRTKKDVLKDLPDKIEDIYYCKMDKRQKDIYDSFVVELREDINKNGGDNILALLTRLRQVCITPELLYQDSFSNTKINLAIDLIKSSIDSGHRILLFSQFASSFPILSRELEKVEVKHFILDGKTKAKTRMEMVEEFNKNDDIKVFIISLKAGGTGLNLIGADTVIHLDPWWNSSAELQATDRAYRIGQTKNVNVMKLICKDTIEEKVILLQNIKKELASSIVDEKNRDSLKLTKEEILELLD